MNVISINGHLPKRCVGRAILAAYPKEGLFVIEYAATGAFPSTKVYFNQDGKEVFAVEES